MRRATDFCLNDVARLLQAAGNGWHDDVRLLLEYPYQMSPDACNSHGRTALMAASHAGNLECARMLLHHKADPNFADEQGNTALHVAAMAGHGALVQTLMREGGKVNCLSSKGRTPFELAIASGHAETMRVLALSGCDVKTGHTQVQQYRKLATFMDRAVKWLSTKQVLAMLSLLGDTPQNRWAHAMQTEWPSMLQHLASGHEQQEQEDIVTERGLHAMLAGTQAFHVDTPSTLSVYP